MFNITEYLVIPGQGCHLQRRASQQSQQSGAPHPFAHKTYLLAFIIVLHYFDMQCHFHDIVQFRGFPLKPLTLQMAYTEALLHKAHLWDPLPQK